MHTPLRALALAIGFMCAAQAQSGVTLYGAVDAGLFKRSAAKMNIGQRDANTLGFKGVEEQGPGLKALFQLDLRYEPGAGALRIGRSATAYMESLTAFAPFHGQPSPAGIDADPERGGAMGVNENTSAWMVGANFTLASGTVLLRYGRQEPDGAATKRQLSIGYEYPLSRRTYVYADASDKKAASTVRHVDIGIRAAF